MQAYLWVLSSVYSLHQAWSQRSVDSSAALHGKHECCQMQSERQKQFLQEAVALENPAEHAPLKTTAWWTL